jgi:hypothetical protein
VQDLTSIDERYFVCSDGRLRTPLKLMSPFSFRQQTGPNLHQKRAVLDKAVLPKRHNGDSQISDSQSIRSSENNSHDKHKSDKKSSGTLSNGSGSFILKKRTGMQKDISDVQQQLSQEHPSEAKAIGPNKRANMQKKLDFSTCSLKSMLN